MGNFDEAFIALIILATAEYIEQWGKRPTVKELLATLARQ